MLNDISRRSFLKTTGAGFVTSQSLSALAGQAQSSTAAGNRKPNIVFVFADQMRSSVLGCYGNTQVPTPHFDRLAANGAAFEAQKKKGLVTCPTCDTISLSKIPTSFGIKKSTPSSNGMQIDEQAILANIGRKIVDFVEKWTKRAEFSTIYVLLHIEDNLDLEFFKMQGYSVPGFFFEKRLKSSVE